MIIILFSYLHNTLYTIFHDTAMHIYMKKAGIQNFIQKGFIFKMR